MRQRTRHAQGITVLEVLVLVAIVLIVAALLLPALASNGRTSKLIKDGTQLKQIHTAWAIYAGEHEDRFPIPGLIKRRPVEFGGSSMNLPGRGAETFEFNTTQNVHAATIMQNYYTPEICVGPTEPNPNVVVKDDYDYTGVAWDPTFAGDLDTLCNFSYASTPLFGERKKCRWLNSYDSKFVAISNRGPRDGIDDPTSLTYKIHGSKKSWQGNVAYNDNHVAVEENFVPEGVEYELDGKMRPDNIFRSDFTTPGDPKGDDVFQTIVSELSPDPDAPNPTFEWD